MGHEPPIFRTPIDNPSLSHNIILWEEGPVMGVAGIISVVAKDKVLILRNIPGSAVVRLSVYIWLIQNDAIYGYMPITNLNVIAWNAYHSLNKIPAAIVRKV